MIQLSLYVVIGILIGFYALLAIMYYHKFTFVYDGHDEECRNSLFAKIDGFGLLTIKIVMFFLVNRNGKVNLEFKRYYFDIWKIFKFRYINFEDYHNILKKYEELKGGNE